MKIGVVCSYAPVELLRAIGVECVTLNGEEDSLEQADGLCHPNLCSFGRALLQQCLRGEVEGLLLTNCCDAMRRVYDQLNAAGTLSFLYFMDLPHRADCCGVERLEKEGAGLNLTWEVRNGIERHTGGEDAATLEGQVVRLADKIAYINHDIEDALRGGVIYPIDIPLEVSQVLGFTHGERINALVVDAISASRGQDRICQSPQVGEAMAVLKEFMFANVYTNPIAKGEESKAQDMLKMLFGYYQKNPDELPADFQAIRLEEGVDRAVCDYIAGMTDPFAVSEYTRLFIPMGWGVK